MGTCGWFVLWGREEMRRSVLSSPSLAMGVVVMLVVVMGWGSGKVEGTSFPFEIPEIVIDLDASPEARWEAAVERVLAKHGFDDSFGSIVAFWDETLPSVLGDVVQDVASSLESYIPQEYAAEMRGLHGALVKAGFGDKMPFSRLVALNLLYELTTACTSIVTEDGEGKMWHARNLDWTFGSHSMANLTVSASFQSQGKTAYRASTWVGFVGVLTGASDVFSVTIDQRTSHTVAEIVENLHRMKADHAQSVVLTARTALSESKTYLEAITTLSSTPGWTMASIASPMARSRGLCWKPTTMWQAGSLRLPRTIAERSPRRPWKGWAAPRASTPPPCLASCKAPGLPSTPVESST